LVQFICPIAQLRECSFVEACRVFASVLPFAGLTDCSAVCTQSEIVTAFPLKPIRLPAGDETEIGGKLAS
jgi:hypothetical protein